ncbi:adenosine deaminase [Photobacterium sp. GJ3]|uniref:adenosine deaminase family protein n=1 Tax=Photobacterium sp. GJ3 TaxID=2829502 RepID=UPI001B8B0880|nr:adenosine deaminase [Photobacterium sp. GJ3]QUJ68620.1 adenosine deaminase [Photobacterium sp. GJ3]
MDAVSSLSLTEFIRRLPKADIHYHLLGGVRLETMLDLARKYGVDLPESEARSYYRAYQTPGGPRKGGIAALTFLYSLMQEAEDYARVLLEVAEDAHHSGVKYIETFWNPSDVCLPYETVNQALIKAIAQSQRDFEITIRLIPSINREKSPEEAVAMVEAMIAHPHPYVLGIGIDYKEHQAPVEHFWKAYQLASRHGYQLTAHCSEFGLHWRNVETGIELIGVDRIDHGYSIIDNPALTRKYAALGIPFTVVPSNTYFLQQWPDHDTWCQKHPIRAMAKAGLNIIPCTDDWHMHDTTTTKCYQVMVEDLGFDVLSLKTMMCNSLAASWMPQIQKEQWTAEWCRMFDALYAALEDQPGDSAEDLIRYRREQTIK